jgi:sugar phosphate isomerase/epimerase
MKLIVFSKSLKEKSLVELIELARKFEIDGYDLCVRPGYPINPDNAARELVRAARQFGEAGLSIPMVTANFDVLYPDHPNAVPILSAMDEVDIRLIKLGYFEFDPLKQDFWEEVDKIRDAFEGWQNLGERYNVKICYHTHSIRNFSSNASMLAHLIRGFDTRYIGAYLDTGHMVIEGEEFCVAASVLKEYLSIVSLKDILLVRKEKNGHGSIGHHGVEAGKGMVDRTDVFETLSRLEYRGPLSVHCEFEVPEDGLLAAIKRETAFFRDYRKRWVLTDD